MVIGRPGTYVANVHATEEERRADWLMRARAYGDAGADALFPICWTVEHARWFRSQVEGPLMTIRTLGTTNDADRVQYSSDMMELSIDELYELGYQMYIEPTTLLGVAANAMAQAMALEKRTRKITSVAARRRQPLRPDGPVDERPRGPENPRDLRAGRTQEQGRGGRRSIAMLRQDFGPSASRWPTSSASWRSTGGWAIPSSWTRQSSWVGRATESPWSAWATSISTWPSRWSTRTPWANHCPSASLMPSIAATTSIETFAPHWNRRGAAC